MREAFRRADAAAFERMSDADAPRLLALATVAFGVLVFATLGLALFAGPRYGGAHPSTTRGGIAPLLAARRAVHAAHGF